MHKCLHLSANTYPPLYGKHHHTKNIWLELAKGFGEYHVIARSETNSYNYSNERNIHLHLVPRVTKKSKIFFITSFWMFWIIKKYKITHLLSQCPIVGGFTATLASKIFKIPLMVEVNGRDYIKWDEQKSFFGLIRYIQNYVFKNSTKVRYPNNDIKNFLEKNNIKNGCFIPHRVQHSLFKKQKNDFKITSEYIKIISIGRFVWEKDYLFLIQTLQSLDIKIELTLIGGGSKKDKYLNILDDNHSKFKLILIDWIQQSDMINLVIKSDIYIQSSISETGPRTVLEAMAMQMPILSSNVGFFPDIVDKYKCGAMFNAHDKEDLVKNLLLLIENEDLRREAAVNGYKVSLEHYEWNKVFELYRNEINLMEYK